MVTHSSWYLFVRAMVRAMFYTACSIFLLIMMGGFNPIAYVLVRL